MRHDTLYRVYLMFTIIGVIGAWVGILAIFRQTKAATQAALSSAESAAAAARSAKAAEDSARLQEAAFRQWVDIKNWTLGQFGDDMFRLDFNVINPTDKPLRLDLVVTDIDDEKGTREAVTNFLIPQRPYRISRLIEYTDEQKRQWKVGTLVLTVGCSMFFSDAANVQWEQRMDFWLTFGKEPLPMAMTETRIRLRYSGDNSRVN